MCALCYFWPSHFIVHSTNVNSSEMAIERMKWMRTQYVYVHTVTTAQQNSKRQRQQQPATITEKSKQKKNNKHKHSHILKQIKERETVRARYERFSYLVRKYENIIRTPTRTLTRRTTKPNRERCVSRNNNFSFW